MKRAIDETNRRRRVQTRFNEEHDITPVGITKEVRALAYRLQGGEAAPAAAPGDGVSIMALPREQATRMIKDLEAQMKRASRELEFERAAVLRDQIVELRRSLLE
jgi:excinuclease ABC subunit B